MYIDIIHRLRDAVRRKRHEKWKTNTWLLLHDNAPEQPSVLVEDFLAKNNMKTLQPPPYSLHLAPADFCFFPRLKSALKARDFCDATDMIKNATEELKMLSQNFFHDSFQRLHSRWK